MKTESSLQRSLETGLFGATGILILFCLLVFPKRPLEAARIAGILLFFFWPGWFLLRWLKWRPEVGFLARMPLAFAASMVIWYPIALMAYSIRCSTSTALFIAVTALCLPGVLSVFFRPDTISYETTISKRDVPWIIPASLLVFFLLVMVWPLRMDGLLQGDPRYFLTITRKFAELDRINLFSAHVPEGMVDRAYGLNAYLLAVGLLSRLLNQDVLLVWGTLSVYGLFFFILSVYLLASRLFESVRIGLAVMVLVTIYHICDYFAFPPFSYANPSMITRPLAMVLLWIFTEVHQDPGRRNRLAFGLVGAAVLAVHPFGVLVTFTYVASALVMSILIERGEERAKIVRETALAGVFLILLAAPYLILKYIHFFSSPNSSVFTLDWDHLNANIRRFLLPITVENGQGETTVIGYITNPSLMLHSNPLVGWIGIPLLGLLFLRRSNVPRLHASLLLGGILCILAVSYNPYVFPLAARFLSVDQVCRLGHKTPIHGVAVIGAISVAIALLLGGIRSKWPRAERPIMVVLILLFIIFVAGIGRDRYETYTVAMRESRNDQGRFIDLKATNFNDDPFVSAIRSLPPEETVLNASAAVEKWICPLANIRVYGLYKDNWGSANLLWDSFKARRQQISSFAQGDSDARRLETIRDLGLRYVITQEDVQLREPFFTLISNSDRSPGLSLYKAAETADVPETAGN